MHSYTTLLELYYKAKEQDFDDLAATKLEEALIDNVREENANLKGLKSELSIIKEMIKTNKKYNPELMGYIVCGERYAFATMHRVIITNDNYGYNKAINQLDVANMFDNYGGADKTFEIDISDLRAHIAVNKATHKDELYTVICSGVECSINPHYAIESIKVSGSNVFHVMLKPRLSDKQNINPYYQFNEDNELVSIVLAATKRKGK